MVIPEKYQSSRILSQVELNQKRETRVYEFPSLSFPLQRVSEVGYYLFDLKIYIYYV